MQETPGSVEHSVSPVLNLGNRAPHGCMDESCYQLGQSVYSRSCVSWNYSSPNKMYLRPGFVVVIVGATLTSLSSVVVALR
jgi:hypothetical protein